MPAAFKSAGTVQQGASTTTLASGAPSSYANGDHLFLFAIANGNAQYPTTPSGWTEVASVPNVHFSTSCARLYRKQADSTNDIPTLTWGTSRTEVGSVMCAISGHEAASPVNDFSATAESTTMTFGTVSTVTDGIVIGFLGGLFNYGHNATVDNSATEWADVATPTVTIYGFHHNPPAGTSPAYTVSAAQIVRNALILVSISPSGAAVEVDGAIERTRKAAAFDSTLKAQQFSKTVTPATFTRTVKAYEVY